MNIDGCIDCDIATGKRLPIGGIIYEDDYWIINHASPKILGHLILKPKSHYEHIADLDEEVMSDFGLIVKRISQAVMKVCKPERVYVASFGEVEPHVHFHFIPRYKGMPSHAGKVLQEYDDNQYACTEADILSRTIEIRAELTHLLAKIG